MNPEQLEEFKRKRAEASKRRWSRPEVREQVRISRLAKRLENDADPERREERLAKRRKQDYLAGRSHPPKPRVTDEHKKQIHFRSYRKWYTTTREKGRSDYMSGLVTKESIAYAQGLVRGAMWRDAHPERVKAAQTRCRLKREMMDANSEIDAAWRSVGIFD